MDGKAKLAGSEDAHGGLFRVQLADGVVCTSRQSLLAQTLSNLELPELGLAEVVRNNEDRLNRLCGGQAFVYICRWKNPPAEPGQTGSATPTIPDGQLVAFKHLLLPHGGGQFVDYAASEEAFASAERFGRQALSLELHLLNLLHSTGCGARVVKPLGMVCWPGKWLPETDSRREKWYWKPTYGYAMPAYPRGSVSQLLADICYRVLPEAAAERYVGHATLASEYLALLTELRRMHTTPGVCLQLQDLTANNLLVDDDGDTGGGSGPGSTSAGGGSGGGGGGGDVRFLFADPAMALPIGVLQQQPPPPGSILGTWMWGSMKARSRLYDPTADLYSLSFVFAELWLVAEGAAVPVCELVQQLHMTDDLPLAVQFVRCTVSEMIQSSYYSGTIKPRTKRHLPVSWLGGWLLLLGFRDHRSEADMRSGLPCLRPSEEEMLGVAGLWARVTAAAQDLPEGLTLERATSEGCRALVTDMCALYSRLLHLTYLDDLTSADEIGWLAQHFMTQEHPLVAAMKAQGAVVLRKGDASFLVKASGWSDVVRTARRRCGHVDSPKHVVDMMQEHRQRVLRGEQLEELWNWWNGGTQSLPALAARLQQAAVAAGLHDCQPQPKAVAVAPAAAAGAAAEGPGQSTAAGMLPAAAASLDGGLGGETAQLVQHSGESGAPRLAPLMASVQALEQACKAAPCSSAPRVGQKRTAAQAEAASGPAGLAMALTMHAQQLFGEAPSVAELVAEVAGMPEQPPVDVGQAAPAGLQHCFAGGAGGDPGEDLWGLSAALAAAAAAAGPCNIYPGLNRHQQQPLPAATLGFNLNPLVWTWDQPAAAEPPQASCASPGAAVPALAATVTTEPAAVPAAPAAGLPVPPKTAAAVTQDKPSPRGRCSGQRRFGPAVRFAQPPRSLATATTPSKPLAAAEPSPGSAARPRKRLRLEASAASGATGPVAGCPGQADASGAPGGCGQAVAAGGPADIYPRLNSCGEPVEGAEAWLARIRPQLEAGMLEAVVPGERQLDAFKGRITTLELARQLLALWRSAQPTTDTSVAGVEYNLRAKGQWSGDVWGRLGLNVVKLRGFDSGRAGQREGKYSRQLVMAMSKEVAPAVLVQLEARMAAVV